MEAVGVGVAGTSDVEKLLRESKALKARVDQLERENSSLKKSIYELSTRYSWALHQCCSHRHHHHHGGPQGAGAGAGVAAAALPLQPPQVLAKPGPFLVFEPADSAAAAAAAAAPPPALSSSSSSSSAAAAAPAPAFDPGPGLATAAAAVRSGTGFRIRLSPRSPGLLAAPVGLGSFAAGRFPPPPPPAWHRAGRNEKARADAPGIVPRLFPPLWRARRFPRVRNAFDPTPLPDGQGAPPLTPFRSCRCGTRLADLDTTRGAEGGGSYFWPRVGATLEAPTGPRANAGGLRGVGGNNASEHDPVRGIKKRQAPGRPIISAEIRAQGKRRKRSMDRFFIWNLQTMPPDSRILLRGGLPRLLQGHSAAVYVVQHSPCGKFLASGSFDKAVKIWDTVSTPKERPSQVACFRDHNLNVSDVSWSADSAALVSGAYDQTCKTWAIEEQKLSGSFDCEGFVQCVAFHPQDRNVFFYGTSRNVLAVVDTRKGGSDATLIIRNDAMVNTLLLPLPRHTHTYTLTPFAKVPARFFFRSQPHGDGVYVVTGDALGTVKTWDVRVGKCVHSFLNEPTRKPLSHIAMCSKVSGTRLVRWRVVLTVRLGKSGSNARRRLIDVVKGYSFDEDLVFAINSYDNGKRALGRAFAVCRSAVTGALIITLP
ncbi:MAG: WD40-repeat-containing domain protein [Olpidium bornovanus]|uniref:WD40-repeat-containing domain protein n=1 Tax=Olpidium bornovanus TaxID=278681 RepID=A0A8H7ZYX8_9FUNG|nr:MAG: WD40-repeat-containing domain protein [Olpidium bornovanus]